MTRSYSVSYFFIKKNFLSTYKNTKKINFKTVFPLLNTAILQKKYVFLLTFYTFFYTCLIVYYLIIYNIFTNKTSLIKIKKTKYFFNFIW